MGMTARSLWLCALALALPAAEGSKVYLVCEKAGAAPVAVLAEARAGGDVAVLAAQEGKPGACTDRSVLEVHGTPAPEQPQAARVNKGLQQAGSAVASGASILGGAIPGAGIVPALKEALAKPGPVAAIGFNSPQLAPDTRAAVSNVLKTKHDTVKNSISNIR